MVALPRWCSPKPRSSSSKKHRQKCYREDVGTFQQQKTQCLLLFYSISRKQALLTCKSLISISQPKCTPIRTDKYHQAQIWGALKNIDPRDYTRLQLANQMATIEESGTAMHCSSLLFSHSAVDKELCDILQLPYGVRATKNGIISQFLYAWQKIWW